MKIKFKKSLWLLVYLSILCFFITTISADEGYYSNAGARRLGADGLFSLSSYSATLIPISDNQNDFSRPLFQVNSYFLLDGNKKIFFKDIFDGKNKKQEIEDSNWFTSEDYPFISVSKGGYVDVKFDAFQNGILSFNHKGKKLYLKTDEKIEAKAPSSFYFAHLFYDKSENEEFQKELQKHPAFTKLINELKVCTNQKSEDCFSKYLYLYRSEIGDTQKLNAKIKDMKDIFLRAHVDANPKAYKYLKKSNNNKDIDEDTHIPPEVEKMIEREKSKVWNWLDGLLSLKLNNDFYINFKSDNQKEGINHIFIHSDNNTFDLTFRKNPSDMKWYIEKFQLSSDNLQE